MYPAFRASIPNLPVLYSYSVSFILAIIYSYSYSIFIIRNKSYYIFSIFGPDWIYTYFRIASYLIHFIPTFPPKHMSNDAHPLKGEHIFNLHLYNTIYMKACQPLFLKKLLSTASVQNDNDNQASKPLILLGSKWELPVYMPLA